VAGICIPVSAFDLLSQVPRTVTRRPFGTVIDPFNVTSCRRKERASQISKAMFHDRGQPSGPHYRSARITHDLSYAPKMQSRLSPEHRSESGAEVFAVSSFPESQRGMLSLVLQSFQASLF
jgi:hypothetical protein